MPKPDFIILGAMKAGTTSLYDYCDAHPQIGMSRLKETDFFIVNKNWARGENWYLGQFPDGAICCGEASPNYTKAHSFPGVPERIARFRPDCRFIFLARDPVARAESQYRHAVLSGRKLPEPEALFHSSHFDHFVSVSSYAFQIQLYLEYFPMDRFLFLDFDDLRQRPAQLLSQVAGFLGVQDTWPAQRSANRAADLAQIPQWAFRLRETRGAHWVKRVLPRRSLIYGLKAMGGQKRRTVPPWSDALRDKIAAALRDDVRTFRKLTGIDFANWSV